MTVPINSQGANPGGPAAPSAVPAALNQPIGPTPPTTGSTTDPAAAINNLTINSLLQPAPLKVFIYSPSVRVVIAHNEIEFDVSADLVRCQLVRPENSAASFFFTLQNKGLRYTQTSGLAPFFSRMDRIVVYMTKTSEIQVFSGYLDMVPYKQLYAGTVDFKATCTIKRIMHTWWDPALPQSMSLLNQVQFAGGQADSGMGLMLQNILTNVGGWNVANIHIQNFPTSFLQFMLSEIAQLQSTNTPNLMAFESMIGDTGSAPGAYVGANPNSGPPGPQQPTGTGDTGPTGTAFYISQIVAACDAKGLGPIPVDNTVATALQQAGATGATSGSPLSNPTNQQAWEQVESLGSSLDQTTRNSDGAILGVACAMVASGAGVAILNLYNPSVVGSEAFPNDGPCYTGTECGIFGQTSSGWGTVAQRMNPMQAAGMFFAALQGVSGWRNMDAGQAIQQAQNSAVGSSVAYDAAITQATTLVQAYRTSQAGTASTVIPSGSMTVGGTTVPQAASSVGASTGGMAGAVSSIPGAVAASATTIPSPVSLLSTVNPTTQIAPQPNSEGAINFMRTCIGLPYVWGGTGPAGYDCSGLMMMGFKSIGVAIPRTTQQIAAQIQRIPNAGAQRGDMVEPSSGHVVMWMGDGTIIEAQQTGVPILLHPNPYGTNWSGVFRACLNGGVNPSAPFNAPWAMGPGTPPGALDQVGGVTGTGSNGTADPTAQNLMSYLFNPGAFSSDTAGLFTGTKAFIEGQPLIQIVHAICSASLRCWSSAPNGDFMAWYPDYWGLDGKPAVMLLADIELKDARINFSDEPLTTHVYINGDLSMTGQIEDPTSGWIQTAGVATVEQPWLYARLISVAPGDLESAAASEIMQRFGIRPLQQSYAMAGTQELEFLLACQVFMEQWAKQYQTTISMTFMPELFAGMRVEMPDRSLQVYVNAVSHTCDYEQGFFTQVTISAPSNPLGAGAVLTGTVASPVAPNNITVMVPVPTASMAAGSGP
jgi:cell wall-associated NlpC family hydrolase